jgi:hypothetical protein
MDSQLFQRQRRRSSLSLFHGNTSEVMKRRDASPQSLQTAVSGFNPLDA